MLHLFNVFHENDVSENCAKVLEEEFNKMFGIKSLNDKRDWNDVSMLAMNIHYANMQIPKLGDAIFDEENIFSPPVLMRIFILMVACLLFMMIILMKVGLEECQL